MKPKEPKNLELARALTYYPTQLINFPRAVLSYREASGHFRLGNVPGLYQLGALKIQLVLGKGEASGRSLQKLIQILFPLSAQD